MLITVLLVNISSAVPVEEWNKTYGGTNDDHAYSGQQTADRGYILAGRTASFGAGGDDAYIVKTNPKGHIIWSKTFGGIYNDSAGAIQQTIDKGYIFAGELRVSQNASRVWLVKIDKNGNKVWEKLGLLWDPGVYRGSRDLIRINSVQQTFTNNSRMPPDGYIIGGTTSAASAGGGHLNFIVKTDITGNELWNYTFGSGGMLQLNGVRQTLDGGYIMVDSDFGNTLLQKVDVQGNMLWSNILKVGSSNTIQQTHTGDYILGGYNSIAKADINGNVLWNITLNNSVINSVSIASDGGYIFTGTYLVPSSGDRDMLILKTDPNGNNIWSATFGGTKNDYANYGQQTKDGDYILIGSTQSYGAGGYDAWLVKIKMLPT